MEDRDTNSLAYSYDNGLTWTGLGTSIFPINDPGVRGLAYGNGMWIACGGVDLNSGTATNTLAYSYNGIDWVGLGITVFSGSVNLAYGVAYNGVDKWVAVGMSTNTIAYSSNGTQWTGTGRSVITERGLGVAYGNGLWIVVGIPQAGEHSICHSSDGITWTGLGTTIFVSGNGVVYGGGRWVAVGAGTNTIAYSDDGLQWTGLGTTIFNWVSGGYPHFTGGLQVAYGVDKYVAIGRDTTYNTLAYSYNGITWVGLGRSIFPAFGLTIYYDGYRWIAGGRLDGPSGNSTGNFTLALSDDGITWVGLDKTTFPFMCAAVAGNNAGIIDESVYCPIAYSYDAVDWTGIPTTLIKHGYDVIYSDTKFVCVGEAFTNSLNNILTSEDAVVWTAITNNLLNYSPTVSRIISLDAEELTGYTNGQAVTDWNGWIPNNISSPPLYDINQYPGGKFVVLNSHASGLKYNGNISLNSATSGWTINFQIYKPLNNANGKMMTLQSTSPSVLIEIFLSDGVGIEMFCILYLVSKNICFFQLITILTLGGKTLLFLIIIFIINSSLI